MHDECIPPSIKQICQLCAAIKYFQLVNQNQAKNYFFYISLTPTYKQEGRRIQNSCFKIKSRQLRKQCEGQVRGFQVLIQGFSVRSPFMHISCFAKIDRPITFFVISLRMLFFLFLYKVDIQLIFDINKSLNKSFSLSYKSLRGVFFGTFKAESQNFLDPVLAKPKSQYKASF